MRRQSCPTLRERVSRHAPDGQPTAAAGGDTFDMATRGRCDLLAESMQGVADRSLG